MRHVIHVYTEPGVGPLSRAWRLAIRRAARRVLRCEGVDEPVVVNVTVVGEMTIAQLNQRMRGKSGTTDVLSFPNLDCWDDRADGQRENARDPETGRLDLGDVAICLPVVLAQAKQLQQSAEREISYMTVHSTLHLLGYDHIDEAEQKQAMRAREKAILATLGDL